MKNKNTQTSGDDKREVYRRKNKRIKEIEINYTIKGRTFFINGATSTLAHLEKDLLANCAQLIQHHELKETKLTIIATTDETIRDVQDMIDSF